MGETGPFTGLTLGRAPLVMVRGLVVISGGGGGGAGVVASLQPGGGRLVVTGRVFGTTPRHQDVLRLELATGKGGIGSSDAGDAEGD